MCAKNSFSKISDDEEMSDYLRRVLERPLNNCKKDHSYLYHYTSVESAVSIIKSKSLWLNSYVNMNDLFERELLDSHGLAGTLHYISLSCKEDGLALYDRYNGNERDGVAIRLSFKDMQVLIDSTEFGEETDGVFGDGKYHRVRRLFGLVRGDRLTKECIWGYIYCGMVAYFNPVNRSIECGTVSNRQLCTPFESEDLSGFVKYSCWDYEKEVRLFVLTEDAVDLECRISVPLFDVVKNIEIITSPLFDQKKYHNELVSLRKLGVVVRKSIYTDCVKIE